MDFLPTTFIPGGMAESVDAVDLKSADRKVVGVQVSLPPYNFFSVLEVFCDRKHNFAVLEALCFLWLLAILCFR